MTETDLVEIAKLFLVPSGLFLAALGSARTEPLKFAVSLLGFVITLFWLYSVWDVPKSGTRLDEVAFLMPWVFALVWLASTLTHAKLWFFPNSVTRKNEI